MAFTALNTQAPPLPEVDAAFAGNHELRKRVHAAVAQNPSQSILFRDICTYILNHASTLTSASTSASTPAEPAAKKRKLQDDNNAQSGAATTSTSTSTSTQDASLGNPTTTPWRSFPAVSFSIPQRKKLTLQLLDAKGGGIRAVGATGHVEFAVAWKDVDQVFCLPVPEKAKKQHNFVVIPAHGDGVSPVPDQLKASVPEPIVWTFEEATGKNVVEGEDPGPAPVADAIRHCLKQAATGKDVVFPDAAHFSSAVPESHRKSEKAYHVKAHRGSKEGYLFFTSVGILYGFKKPLAFFDFAAINSISYTAVLRNTFNLVITTPTQEIEFGMLDQADFAGINEYVQNHGLQDASLAADRRAKKLNVNKTDKTKENGVTANGGGGAGGEEEGEEEESEIQKAQRLLQEQEDEDDEDEEDYDPGSEGESEGSGSDTDDDEEDGEGYEDAELEEEDDEAEGEEMEEQ